MPATDSIFKAIAHPARRQILHLLSTGARSVKELHSEFSISQPAISQHLRELRNANLVASDRVGLEQRYRLTASPLKSVYDWSMQYRTFFDPAGHAWTLFPTAAQPRNKEPAMAVEGSVPLPGVIVPHLVVRDAAHALAFYEAAFSALVLYRSPSPSGHGEHIHLKLWDSLIQLSTEEPAQRNNRVEGALLASPETLSASTCVFQVGVPDVDEAYKRAVDHGASPALPPMDMFWGDRYGWVRDPFGHVWAFAQVKEVLTAAEIEARMRHFTATPSTT